MKKIVLCLVILLSISCTVTFPRFPSSRQHADPFYNYNDKFAPGAYLPLIDPYFAVEEYPSEVTTLQERLSSPWQLGFNTIWIQIPNSGTEYPYSSVEELEKFAVQNGVIMAYSSYVDTQADAYIQNNYYQ